jgi:hypothetical protein
MYFLGETKVLTPETLFLWSIDKKMFTKEHPPSDNRHLPEDDNHI